MDAAVRPQAILVPLVVATAVRARGLARNRVKTATDNVPGSNVILMAVADGVAAAGVLEAAVVVKEWKWLLFCIVGAVLPAIGAFVDLWVKSPWARYSKTTGGLFGILLSGIGATMAVFYRLDKHNQPQAASAYASLLPSIALILLKS